MRIPIWLWPQQLGRAFMVSKKDGSRNHLSPAMPKTLWEAAQTFKTSAVARDLFGDSFVDHFAATREWEELEFLRHITDWELKRYSEII